VVGSTEYEETIQLIVSYRRKSS